MVRSNCMRLRILHVEQLERLSGAPVQLDAPRRRQRVVKVSRIGRARSAGARERLELARAREPPQPRRAPRATRPTEARSAGRGHRARVRGRARKRREHTRALLGEKPRSSITSPTPCGMPIDQRARISTSARSPSAASRRTTSPTKNGLPSVSAWIAVTSSAGRCRSDAELDVARNVRGREPANLDAMRHLLAGELCKRRSEGIAHRRVDVAVCADDEYPAVAQLTRRSPSSSSEGSSAACRSSRTRTSGHTAAAFFRKRAAESKSRMRAPSASSEGSGSLGRARAAQGRSERDRRHRPRAASAELPARPARCPSAATAPPASRRGRRLPAPADEHACPALARWRITSSARRLLPMPGSPASRNRRPRPATVASSPPRSSSTSDSRPTRIPATRSVASPAPLAETRSSPGSCRRIALSSSRNVRPGSIPSPSTSGRPDGPRAPRPTAGAVEREHQLCTQRLAQGVSSTSRSSSATSSE